MRLFHAGVSRIAPTLCAAVAAATLAAPTQAQLGEAAGFQEAMVPDFFKRDVQLFINGLGLDESQRVILEMLLVDYQDDFDSGTQGMIDKFQEMISELQGGDQRRVMQIVFEPLREWHHDKLALRDQFLITVQSVLLLSLIHI